MSLSLVQIDQNKCWWQMDHEDESIYGEVLKVTDMPKALEILHSYSRLALKDGSCIPIPMDGNVFGNEFTIRVFFEEVHNLCELKAISAACIYVYICHLYRECENSDLLGRFRFHSPYGIPPLPTIDSTQKADVLAKRLIGTSPNQLVLVPSNVGWHWIVMVIDPHKETVYWLDPLNHEDHFDQWKSVMEMAMKLFNMNIGKRGRKNILWEVIKCPQQPDGKQCGFYVMRFMKDVIGNCGSINSIPITSVFSKGYYTKKEIDEVRTEWAEFVYDFTD